MTSEVQAVMTGIGNRTEEGLALEQSARLRMELPGASLRGVGLFGANLSYVWFQNADLSYAYLYVANLSFANFLGANFRVREPSWSKYDSFVKTPRQAGARQG